MKHWHAGAGTLAAIIALTPASVARAQQHPVQPCTVAGLPGVDSTWQQVTGSGFTFCLPADWRRRHPRGDSLARRVWAKSGADSVYFGTGRPTEFDPNAMRTGEITGRVITSGENPGPEPLPLPTSEPPCPQTSQTPFVIGQVALMLTQVACQRQSVITAWASDPAVFLQGTTHSADDARKLLVIVQTMRFTAANQPR